MAAPPRQAGRARADSRSLRERLDHIPLGESLEHLSGGQT